MVSVDDHETGTGPARALARVGPFLAGDQPVLVESNVPSFADLVADRLRDLRGDDARRRRDGAQRRAGPADVADRPRGSSVATASRSACPCPTRA